MMYGPPINAVLSCFAAFLAQLRESEHLFPPDYLENRLVVFMPSGVPRAMITFPLSNLKKVLCGFESIILRKLLKRKQLFDWPPIGNSV